MVAANSRSCDTDDVITVARTLSLSLSHPQMSAVKFGEPGEVPSLLVVSNQRVYFLEITSEPQ